jgi:tetratricopeptide (TPR) repeat protein
VFDSLSTATKDIRFPIASAHTWLYQEDYQKADSVYHKLTNKYPEQQQILVEGARVSERIEEKERALILLKEAYAIGEKPEIALNIAELLTDQKKENEAISYTRKLVGTRYGGIAIFYELKYAQKKLDEAGKKAEQALLKMFQLYASLQQELSGEAENVFESRQLRMPPLLQNKHKITQLNQYIDNWYNYLMDNFSVPQAEGIIAAVCSEYPESPKLHLFEGKIAFRAGHSTLAQESFEKAIRQGARDPEIYFLLGEVYRDRNKYSKSILSYERALTTDASFEKAYQKIVQTSEQQGSLDELCDRWLRRYKNNSDNKMLREYLISALHKADRFEEAKQIIKEG